MLNLIPLILQGAGLGLTACISPGPLLVYLITQSLSGGWKRGAIVAFAPLISDAPIIIAILLLLNRLPPLFLRLISIVGGIFIFYLAWGLWQKWRLDKQFIPDLGSTVHLNLGRAVLMNYLSPGPYMFWTLVNGPLLLRALHQSILHGIVFLVSFYGIFIGGMLVLAGIFAQARRLGPRLVRALLLVSIVILILFGASLLVQGFLGSS
jgi:threonine/homoserine/homoserine lactone efflux protein